MIPVFRYRRFHRWIAVIIGLQLLLWTASGIYFAWTDIDEIHGDFTRADEPAIPADESWASPSVVMAQLPEDERAVELLDVDVIDVAGVRLYRIEYVDGTGEERVLLADAVSGALRPPLSEAEAVALARRSFAPESELSELALLDENDVGLHHEYRGRPLPAYRISFDHPAGTHVYVAAEHGQVLIHRNAKWRVFDFLWMLHTMDYLGRDDINNPLLRTISLAGLAVVLSGYLLWWMTRSRRRSRA